MMAATTLLSACCVPNINQYALWNSLSNPADAMFLATGLYCLQILPAVGVSFTHPTKLKIVFF